MPEQVYWVWLQQIFGVGSRQIDKFLQIYAHPREIYGKKQAELQSAGLFTQAEMQKIEHTDLTGAESIVRKCAKNGIRILTPDSEDFPERLKQIDGIPCVLYALGNISDLDEEIVLTMVGTRTSSVYGETAAHKLSYDLATAGCIVVSGLAVGIDYASHEGALSAQGRTIGVLACGFDVDYPTKSNKLKRRILEKGALITEFPFGTRPFPGNFAVRNRLLSGLAVGVIVIQAAEKSGALITAHHALAQNRDVFAVPGDIFDKSMTGCNKLIHEGAKMVRNVYSVLEEYLAVYSDKLNKNEILEKLHAKQFSADFSHVVSTGKKKAVSSAKRLNRCDFEEVVPEPPKQLADVSTLDVSELAKKLLTVIGSEIISLDDAVRLTELSARELLIVITELELSDLIEVLPGQRYSRKGSEVVHVSDNNGE